MVTIAFTLTEDYWDTFQLREEDIEFLYNYLLEEETPLTIQELIGVLVVERIKVEKQAIEKQRKSGGDTYLPKGEYDVDQRLVFPALSWQKGSVVNIRPGNNPSCGDFKVIEVLLEGEDDTREFASQLEEHDLNEPPDIAEDGDSLNPESVLKYYGDFLKGRIEDGLEENTDFVRIAGKWFPRALLLDVNMGQLNLAEASLDMEEGGPLPTSALLDQIELKSNVNINLLEFSLDLALQEDERFDEVGPAGEVLWFLKRLEPDAVLQPPMYLRYSGMDYDRNDLTDEMLDLERELDDELSPLENEDQEIDAVEVRLIYPHLRAGTLPLSARIRHLFPTAYEAPRIRFTLVDGKTGDKFPAWVVRKKRYVYGLKEWYSESGLLPGSIVTVKRGKEPGEVIVETDQQSSNREWIRTVLVGSDGGVVFAMLKQIVTSNFDERMVTAVPDNDAIDQVWQDMKKKRTPFEGVVVNLVRELAKLNPQNHVHATELYAALNILRRCPPGPLLALLASRPWFEYVGDLHYRLNDSENI